MLLTDPLHWYFLVAQFVTLDIDQAAKLLLNCFELEFVEQFVLLVAQFEMLDIDQAAKLLLNCLELVLTE